MSSVALLLGNCAEITQPLWSVVFLFHHEEDMLVFLFGGGRAANDKNGETTCEILSAAESRGKQLEAPTF